jgi:hypothetical protein
MTAAVTNAPGIVVTLSCDLCPARVVHTDTVTLDLVAGYLSRAGWIISSPTTTAPQTTLCPRCSAHARPPAALPIGTR